MPDRWDAEVKDALCCCGRPHHDHTEHCPAMSSRVTHVAAVARRAYREGLERGEHLARIWPDGCGASRDIAAAIRREIEGA